VSGTCGLFALAEVKTDEFGDDYRDLIHVPTGKGVSRFTHDWIGETVGQQLYAFQPSLWAMSSEEEIRQRTPKPMQDWIRNMRAYDHSDGVGVGLSIKMIRTLREFIRDQQP
jgi:hypothetical protein